MSKEAIALLEKAIIHVSMIQSNSRKQDLIRERTVKLIGFQGATSTGILYKILTLLKQQPTAGEWTKECREVIIEGPVEHRHSTWVKRLLEACDRLDRVEARNKIKDKRIAEFEAMVKAGTDILPALKKIKKTQKIDPFYLDTLIAILGKVLKQSDSRPVEGETDNPDPIPDHEFPC